MYIPLTDEELKILKDYVESQAMTSQKEYERKNFSKILEKTSAETMNLYKRSADIWRSINEKIQNAAKC